MTVIPLFPRNDPSPDFSFLTAEDVAAILAIPWAAAITGLDRVAHRSRAILSPVPS